MQGQGHWLSWGLLMLAYATFGQLLHSNAANLTLWLFTLAFLVFKASVLTLFWRPARDFVLRGFQSDVGYIVMVLTFALGTVMAVVYFRAFGYVLVLVATAILVRVDCLIEGMEDFLAFLLLVGLPLAGLGLSWLPTLLLKQAVLGS